MKSFPRPKNTKKYCSFNFVPEIILNEKKTIRTLFAEKPAFHFEEEPQRKNEDLKIGEYDFRYYFRHRQEIKTEFCSN